MPPARQAARATAWTTAPSSPVACSTSGRTSTRSNWTSRGRDEPGDNAYIEAFKSRLRQECLNASWFLSMGDGRARIEARRVDYNQNRPHSALGGLTPAEFAGQLKPARMVA